MHFTSDKRSWRLSHVVSKDRPFTTSEETWLENGPKHLAQKATVRYMERYGGKSWRWHGHTIVVQRSSTCLFFWTLFLDFVGWMMPLPSCTYLVISRVLDTSEANIMVFSMSFSSSFSIAIWGIDLQQGHPIFKQTQPRAIFSTLLYLYLSDLCYPYIPDHPRIYPMDSSINIYLPAID